jgi:sugar transferase EpsL
MGKRIFDVVLTFIAFLILSPLLVAIAIMIRFVIGRPILFAQTRPGMNGRPFTLYKFRTMADARNADGKLLPDADRLTPLGRFLRSTSLDELPELINILKGDMSIVGPRPLLMQYLERYTLEQTKRHDVKPGLTGWAQINGRNAISWEEKFKMDVWYVDNHSFWLDLKIIALTIKKVLTREGISADGEATMPEFLGSDG